MNSTIERIAERAPDATASTAMNVYGCIIAVASEMASQGIAKSRSNQQQGYKFRGIDEVMNALSPLLAKHKLLILPRVLSREVVERSTKTGGVLFYVVVEAEFDFVSAVDGSRHTVKTYGEAMDSADKATNKAMSAAYKYAAFQTFCIPTEGDNDADAHSHEVAARTPAPTIAAISPSREREKPSVPNGGASGQINTQTGEELQAELPPGYHYIQSYTFDRGWYEIEILDFDAKGGSMKLSTKLPAIGKVAEQAWDDHRPVKVEWQPKKNGARGEGYLNKVHLFADPLPVIQIRDNHADPVDLDAVPF